MSSLDDIEAAALALNGLIAGDTGRSTAINQAVAAALAAIVAPARTIYVDEIGGIDTNAGTTAATAVKTLGQAVAMGSAGQALYIGLLSDVNLQQGFVTNAPQVVIFSINPDNTTPSTPRTLSFLPAALITYENWIMAIAVRSGRLVFSRVNLRLAGALVSGASPIGLSSSASLLWGIGTLIIDTSAGGPVPLLKGFDPCNIYFTNITLPSNYAGHLFADVAAGANPNANIVYRSNITSA